MEIVLRPWPAIVLFVATLLSLPLLVTGGSLLFPAREVWGHLAHTVLTDYGTNSLVLMLLVGVGTFGEVKRCSRLFSRSTSQTSGIPCRA
jgi:ABC-type Fe3+ transport system permease subunit